MLLMSKMSLASDMGFRTSEMGAALALLGLGLGLGLFLLGAAPQAPLRPRWSTMVASHSTVPSMDRLEP